MIQKKSKKNNEAGQPDWWLFAITFVLLVLGLTMVFSASGIKAEQSYSDIYYFFNRQLIFAVVGCVLLVISASMPRSLLYKLQYPGLFFSVFLLILTLSPLGVSVNGSQRWLKISSVNFQIMEFAKIALVMYLAYFMATKQSIIRTFSKGVIPPFLVTSIMCLLLLMQPDFGGAALMLLLLFFMCIVGGTRPIYILLSAFLAMGGAYLLVTRWEYRFNRILAFLDPFAVANTYGYQLIQSFYAFGSGGLNGVGLGASMQKLHYLPEAHTDFIFAIFGEEVGLFGISIVFALIAVFFWRCIFISIRQEDLRDRYTAFGLLMVLLLSMVLNMAVVMGVAPPKGVPLPFFSYGGSSLVTSLLCVGLLLNISRTGKA